MVVRCKNFVFWSERATCSCIEYEDNDGFGNCKKPMETYDKKNPVCYVKVPSSCNDLVQKDSKYFSWEACRLENGKYYCIACNIPHLIFLS